LSLDAIGTTQRLSRAEFRERFGVDVDSPFLLVTYHPVTLECEDTGRQIEELLAALDAIGMPVLFTAPNADTQGQSIGAAIRAYVADRAHTWLLDSLGQVGYFTAMEMAAAMVGNSSSGLLEAASFGLPVVDIGTRQVGRMRGRNVIHCGYSREEVLAATRTAISRDFRSSIQGMANPYGSGNASGRIVDRLESVVLDEGLTRKRFIDRMKDGCRRGSGIDLL
jgi:UDP-N-acetylglucosamine 2-epimerase (non-hydrolysing)/GDP/UDP-N,N'-diacetylbacillosamine 2-epimerase (hydrolysing)